MEKEILYFDSDSREWKIGNIGTSISVSNDNRRRLVSLPFTIDAMYPTEIKDDRVDFIYSNCCKCGKSLTSGQLCMEFDQMRWGIRIKCQSSELIRTNILIVNVHQLLAPIIERGWKTPTNKCRVCDRPKCKESDCIKIMENGLLNMTETEEVLEFFYKIKLNVLVPLVDNHCIFCQRKTFRCCKICKAVAICKRCKGKKNQKVCIPFELMWR